MAESEGDGETHPIPSAASFPPDPIQVLSQKCRYVIMHFTDEGGAAVRRTHPTPQCRTHPTPQCRLRGLHPRPAAPTGLQQANRSQKPTRGLFLFHSYPLFLVFFCIFLHFFNKESKAVLAERLGLGSTWGLGAGAWHPFLSGRERGTTPQPALRPAPAGGLCCFLRPHPRVF